jgi:hypothetical protein
MDLEAKNIKEMLHNSSFKAAKMFIIEPIVFTSGLWIIFTWCVNFLFFFVILITFAEKRGWSEGMAGLPHMTPLHRRYHRFRCQLSPDREIYADHESK